MITPIEGSPIVSIPSEVQAWIAAGEQRITFDALGYLQQASDEDLDVLAGARWGHQFSVPQVARWVRVHDSAVGAEPVRSLLDRCDRHSLGYNVGLRGDTTGQFLLATRPAWVLATVLAVARDEYAGPMTLRSMMDGTLWEVTQTLFLATRLSHPVRHLLYRAAFTYGPDTDIADAQARLRSGGMALDHPAVARADLYWAAGVPIAESVGWEADTERRPTEETLRTLAALRGAPA